MLEKKKKWSKQMLVNNKYALNKIFGTERFLLKLGQKHLVTKKIGEQIFRTEKVYWFGKKKMFV